MINLNLEIAEIEAVLKHIGQASYNEVAALIAKIHGQALPQVNAIRAANPPEETVETDAPVNPEQNVA